MMGAIVNMFQPNKQPSALERLAQSKKVKVHASLTKKVEDTIKGKKVTSIAFDEVGMWPEHFPGKFAAIEMWRQHQLSQIQTSPYTTGIDASTQNLIQQFQNYKSKPLAKNKPEPIVEEKIKPEELGKWGMIDDATS